VDFSELFLSVVALLDVACFSSSLFLCISQYVKGYSESEKKLYIAVKGYSEGEEKN
jgi:hypothetical protein